MIEIASLEDSITRYGIMDAGKDRCIRCLHSRDEHELTFVGCQLCKCEGFVE